MPGKRRAAFEAYYKANPDKLKGKSIDEAYAAMRRNVIATGNRSGKNSAGDRTNDAAARERISNLVNQRSSRRRTKNLNPVEAAVARRVERNRSTTEKDMDNIPGLRAKRLSTPEVMRAGFSMEGNRDLRKFNLAKNNPNAGRKSGLSAAQKEAIARRLKNVSNDPAAASMYRRIKYGQSRQA